jgi:hypothetical protein
MPSEARPAPQPLVARIAGSLLLVAALLIPATLMRGKSATFDEVAHLPAGYTYLTTGLFKINPQHPPLIKELCALPLLFLDLKSPVDRERLERERTPLTYQWGFGKAFLFSQDADRILFWGRIPAVILSALLAAVVMVWAGRLWGKWGALLAGFLYVTDPTITAHAQLVTTDVGLAFFSTLFLFLLRRFVERRTGNRLLLAGGALGLALGSKFSGLLLVPAGALLLLAAAWRGGPEAEPAARETIRRPGRPGRGGPPAPRPGIVDPLRGGVRSARLLYAAGAAGVLVGVAAVVVWALYFFPADLLVYFRGLAAVNRDHDPNYLPYLLGEMRPGGWRTYLLVAWLVKTPLPSLLILAAGIVLFARGRRAGWLDEAFLAIPALGYFVGYSLTADNLGVRYLIPCFPLFFVFAGRVGAAAARAGPTARAALAGLLVWQAVAFAGIWPDHLAYFNEIAGGPSDGYRWLDDSNLDWGQGLIQLRDHLRRNPEGEFRFCYFGSGEPAHYGIRGTRVTVDGLLRRPDEGTWILSAHCVARAGAQLARLHGKGPANWIENRRPEAVIGHAYFVYRFR